MNRRRTAAASFAIILLAAAVTVFVVRAIAAGRREPPEIVVVVKAMSPDMEFWQIVHAGIDTAAREFGVEPTVVGPWLERDIDDQIVILGEVIEQRPDGIILAASDFEALARLAERAVAEDIKLVTIDSAVAGEASSSFIATDNIRAGEKAGEAMASIVENGRPVAIVSHIEEVATSIDREHGARAVFERRSDSEIVGTFFSQNTLEIAYQHTVDLLTRHPELGGIIGLNEASTVGVARAIRDEGRAGDVKVVGFDHSQEEISFLEQGVIQALVVQKPFNMGYLSVRALIDVIEGRPVERFIDTGSELITRENMYEPENQQLLFPFFDPAR